MRFTTLTLHPAIDRVVEVERLRPGELLEYRLRMEVPAGKGTNTARALKRLGVQRVHAAVWLGKAEGRFFRAGLGREKVSVSICARPVATRVCMTILERGGGRETHLKDVMAAPTRGEEAELLRFVKRMPLHGACVAVCGSAPKGARATTLMKVLKTLTSRAERVLVDSSGVLLKAAAQAGLYGVKGNEKEIGDWLGLSAAFDPERRAHRDAIQAALRRSEAGAQQRSSSKNPFVALVTLGPRGVAYVEKEQIWLACPERAKRIVSATGCGDAATAGWMWALAEACQASEIARRAAAAGAAKLVSEDPGHLDFAEVQRQCSSIRVRCLS